MAVVFLFDERGTDTIESVAALGFVVVPLVAVLVAARTKIYETLWELWSSVTAQANPQ